MNWSQFSIIWLIIVALSACQTSARISYQPIDIHDPEDTVAKKDIQPQQLREAFGFMQREKSMDNALSLLVVNNGTLVAEGYYNGADSSKRQNVKSVTKSILSLLTGIAIDKGYITSLDMTLGEIFSDQQILKQHPEKASITLRHCLMMSTGLEWVENKTWYVYFLSDSEKMIRSANTVNYVLDQKIEDGPGGHMHYSTGTSQLIAAALQKLTGQSLIDFANQYLFHPLGLYDVEWMRAKDSVHFGGIGLRMTPREMAVIGQLCLQKGSWKGKQLVPAEWVEQSTASQIVDGNKRHYGFQWWVHDFGYSAQGWGGQYIFVLPKENKVVVFTARNNRPSHIGPEMVEALIKKYLLQEESVHEEPAP